MIIAALDLSSMMMWRQCLDLQQIRTEPSVEGESTEYFSPKHCYMFTQSTFFLASQILAGLLSHEEYVFAHFVPSRGCSHQAVHSFSPQCIFAGRRRDGGNGRVWSTAVALWGKMQKPAVVTNINKQASLWSSLTKIAWPSAWALASDVSLGPSSVLSTPDVSSSITATHRSLPSLYPQHTLLLSLPFFFNFSKKLKTCTLFPHTHIFVGGLHFSPNYCRPSPPRLLTLVKYQRLMSGDHVLPPRGLWQGRAVTSPVRRLVEGAHHM